MSNAPAPSEDAQALRILRRNVRSYAASLAATRKLTDASQRHVDRMLTWSVGLMGAGLFALPNLVTTACGPARQSVGLVAAPWAAGIMLALLGRLVAAWHREADAFHFAGK